MSTATYCCENCSRPFQARAADRARGWARFCSKRCKAVKQGARLPRGAVATRLRQPAARRTVGTQEDHQAAEAMARRMCGWKP